MGTLKRIYEAEEGPAEKTGAEGYEGRIYRNFPGKRFLHPLAQTPRRWKGNM